MSLALAIFACLAVGAVATYTGKASPPPDPQHLTQKQAAYRSLFTHFDPLNSCPDMDHAREKACTTGSCSSGLLVGLYAAPSDCTLIDQGSGGLFTLTGTFFAAFDTVLEYSDSNPITNFPVDPSTGYNFTRDFVLAPKALVDELVIALQKDYPSGCCKACKDVYDGVSVASGGFRCSFWQHFFFYGPGSNTGLCLLYKQKTYRPKCFNTTYPIDALNFFGARCDAQTVADPHFVGAHGTPFDFSGAPDETFTLISDDRLVVNTMLTGYLDSRTESATLIKDGKAVRTWIREVGMLWADSDGKVHTMDIAARVGTEVLRGEDGFVASMEVDGVAVAVPKLGEKFTSGDLTLTFVAHEMKGSAEVDYFRLTIAGVVDVDLRLRVAHPLLRTPEDAYAHFSLGFNSLESSENIHGVLGQTFRKSHEERAVKFSQLAAMLHHNIRADDVEGAGFLDGEPGDYRVPSVLSTDFKYNAFKGPLVTPAVVVTSEIAEQVTAAV
eukprot:TRINITY_DN2606_c0_g3_i1.p1 TRINITY_DN2606_c0_g3~~TRINITY_DN2606_c0_g3_i1.p1  ORF type:complete len:497 (+),score=53.00 TRINITY_DN2606_c0_g3_i1:252-1742(+)